MKKLFAMILMASITLPVIAKEVKLQCTESYSKMGKTIWIFDEAAGTVYSGWDKETSRTNTDCKNTKEFICQEYFITPDEFGFERYVKGEHKNRLTINRMDGTMHFSDEDIGTCVPFKQAF